MPKTCCMAVFEGRGLGRGRKGGGSGEWRVLVHTMYMYCHINCNHRILVSNSVEYNSMACVMRFLQAFDIRKDNLSHC